MPRLSKIGAACLSAFGFGTGGAAAVTANYLVVAGGGGGGNGYNGGGAGGGAGGFLTNSISLTLTETYTVIVGAGGATNTGGTNSVISGSGVSTITSVGGGSGGNQGVGGNGGSGGGGGTGATVGYSGGTATSGQGNNGGAGWYFGGFQWSGGGGGGAGAAGASAGNNFAGNGGAGASSSITGTSVTYAGGGGGNSSSGTQGTGGAGGGGNNNVAGLANTGGGGGGGAAKGGSGIAVIAYAGAQKFGGGIVSSDGTNTIHTFKTSGQLVPMTPITASYLIVAGGAGGGNRGQRGGGGGGAGGLLSGSTLLIDTSSTYIVTVGAGGTGAAAGTNANGTSGTTSSLSLVSTIAASGGVGAAFGAGGIGASGGGGSGDGGAGGTVSPSGQGNAGGAGGFVSGAASASGGGGGAGAAGGAGNFSGASGIGGVGGIGIASTISGISTYYAGGGGGAGTRTDSTSGSSGAGGLGGGGNGSGSRDTGPAATSGTAGTGGGGGGADTQAAGNGGSGIVVISYAGTTQLMAGGTVTIRGGNVIHTFTSSGYLTPLTFIGRSLRFRSSASAYLNRTPTVASNRKTWTWSGWVKRGVLSTVHEFFSAYDGSAGQTGNIRFAADNTLALYTGGNTGSRGSISTTAVYRDPAAWYHITAVVDTTQSVSTERLQLYVNGIRQAVTVLETVPQNTDGQINGVFSHRLGNHPSNINYFDGYMADVRFIDGQALTPNSFGTFNSYGVWQPINYGGSYGTNGFHLPFSDTTSTTTLVADKSPQGNNWTPNNISLTAGTTYDSMTDVPTLTSATASNYAVLNPLAKHPSNAYPTFSNANLTAAYSTGDSIAYSTIGVTTGKFYWEHTIGTAGSIQIIGVATCPDATYQRVIRTDTGQYLEYNGGSATWTTYGASSTTGDVIGVALDMTAQTIEFFKNGTSQGQKTSIGLTGLTIMPFVVLGSSAVCSYNFGQRPFVYTPPTGFVALNTYNL